jgi:exopolysaccharide biosynthesis polyprenyl glycosylphosphotransferase
MGSQIIEAVTPKARSGDWGRRREWRRVLMALVLGDGLCITLSFALAYWIRFFVNLEIFRDGPARPEFYRLLTLILLPCWLLLFNLYGLYAQRRLFGGSQEYERLFNASTLGLVLVIIATFLFPEMVIARAWLLLSWACIITSCIAWRFSMRRIIYALRRRSRLLQRAIIIGANAEGRAIAEQLGASPNAGAVIVGFIDDKLPPGSEVLPELRVLGSVDIFEAVVADRGVDSVIIADTEMVRERLVSVYGAMEALRRLDVSLSPGLFELLTIGVEVRELGSIPLLSLNTTRITGIHAFSKRALDVGGALAFLTLLSPLLVIVAILVRRDSRGPVIHRRRVVGVNNTSFEALKFRTMRVDGDALLSPEQREELRANGKLRQDPRITPLGQFLRRSSIDELPQLVNVLRGQMSLVGPRMLTVEELRHFGRWRHNLVTVRPGLTGLWQISGRSTLGYNERVSLDMRYIRNYSIWLDLYIIYRTIGVVISGKGAL